MGSDQPENHFIALHNALWEDTEGELRQARVPTASRSTITSLTQLWLAAA